MSVHRKARLEIRLSDGLKDRIKKYCLSKEIDIADLVRSLLIKHLKYDEPQKNYYYKCDVEDMPGV